MTVAALRQGRLAGRARALPLGEGGRPRWWAPPALWGGRRRHARTRPAGCATSPLTPTVGSAGASTPESTSTGHSLANRWLHAGAHTVLAPSLCWVRFTMFVTVLRRSVQFMERRLAWHDENRETVSASRGAPKRWAYGTTKAPMHISTYDERRIRSMISDRRQGMDADRTRPARGLQALGQRERLHQPVGRRRRAVRNQGAP